MERSRVNQGKVVLMDGTVFSSQDADLLIRGFPDSDGETSTEWLSPGTYQVYLRTDQKSLDQFPLDALLADFLQDRPWIDQTQLKRNMIILLGSSTLERWLERDPELYRNRNLIQFRPAADWLRMIKWLFPRSIEYLQTMSQVESANGSDGGVRLSYYAWLRQNEASNGR